MLKQDEVVEALWECFEESLSRGVPTYFNFTESLITEIVYTVGNFYSRKKAIEAYYSLVHSFFEISGKKVKIKSSVYNTMKNGKSPVILLVSFQVLAVEKMSNNLDYTPEAYFPPLRKMIDEELGDSEGLPFFQEEFEELWVFFAKEVEKISGTSKTVTFNFENNRTGTYKNKIFPLSQGLLNQEDLLILANLYYEKKPNFEFNFKSEWNRFLVENSRHLSKRGCRLLYNSSLRSGLITQLIDFTSIYDFSTISKMRQEVSAASNMFIITLDVNDSPISDEFTYSISFNVDGDQEISFGEGEQRLNNYLIKNDYIAVYRNFGVFSGNPRLSGTYKIYDLGFLCKNDNAVKYLETIFNIPNLKYEYVVVENEVDLRFYYVSDLRLHNVEAQLNRGRVSKKSIKAEITFSGGIRLDERGNFYLSAYPPNKVNFNGGELEGSESIKVDGRIMLVTELLASFEEISEQLLNIEYKGCTTKIFMRNTSKKMHSMFGYKINKRLVSLLPAELKEEEISLVGCNFKNLYTLITFTKDDFISFFIKDENLFQAVNDVDMNNILLAIEHSDKIGFAHKKYLHKFIYSTKNVPKLILKRLNAA